jgi:FtsP/CotA-like multicopper oxidase with cupredoxin domain
LIGSKNAFGASSGRNEGAWRKLRKQAGLMRLNLDRRKFLEISGEAGLALAGGLLAPGSLGTDDRPMSGLMKDTISLPRFSKAEIDFIADDPGATFFHCHHQDHMDEGFAGLITYS